MTSVWRSSLIHAKGDHSRMVEETGINIWQSNRADKSSRYLDSPFYIRRENDFGTWSRSFD